MHETLKWLRFAARNTLRNRRRSLVTVAVAAFGTAGILLAGGFALYTYESLQEASARDTGHLVAAQRAFYEKEEDTPLQYGIENFPALKTTLLQQPEVRYLLPRLQFSGLVSNGDKSVLMLGSGIDPDSEFKVKGPFLNIRAGEQLHQETGAAGGNAPPVMLGEGLARSLNARPGSGLTLLVSTPEGGLNALDVQVQGVFSTGVPEIDKRLVYTTLDTAQSLMRTHKISTLGIYLDDMARTLPVRAALAPELAKQGLAVRTWEEEAVFYRAVRDLYNRIFGTLGAIIAAIVVFVVANAMAMSIVERTREIGALRAMGTAPGQLVRMFALEGGVLGGAGALLGALFALAGAVALQIIDIQMPPPPGRSEGYPLHISVDASMYTGVLIGVSLLAVLCAAWVGRRAAQKPIVEALGHV